MFDVCYSSVFFFRFTVFNIFIMCTVSFCSKRINISDIDTIFKPKVYIHVILHVLSVDYY